MKVIRAKSAGFCWGVERAIQVAREEAQGGRRRGGPRVGPRKSRGVSLVRFRDLGMTSETTTIEVI